VKNGGDITDHGISLIFSIYRHRLFFVYD